MCGGWVLRSDYLGRYVGISVGMYTFYTQSGDFVPDRRAALFARLLFIYSVCFARLRSGVWLLFFFFSRPIPHRYFAFIPLRGLGGKSNTPERD